MNTSIGEQDIVWEAQTVGRVRVLDLAAVPALYPRIGLTIGCTLREHRADDRGVRPTGAYHLVDLIGELWLRDGGPVITEVRWLDRERRVRSLDFEDETQIALRGDLDFARLERLEAERCGEAPTLWLKLYPVLVGAQGLMPSKIHTLRLQPPRDRWVQFLKECGFGSFEILELPIPAVESDRFRVATTELAAAVEQLRAGGYEQCALRCRRAIDAVQSEMPDDKHWVQLRQHLGPIVGDARSAAYVEQLKELKNLGNPAAHPGEPPYRRDEAQLMVRLTASLVSLVARTLEESAPLSTSQHTKQR